VAEVDEIAELITSDLVREEMFPNFRNGPIWDGPLWLNKPHRHRAGLRHDGHGHGQCVIRTHIG